MPGPEPSSRGSSRCPWSCSLSSSFKAFSRSARNRRTCRVISVATDGETTERGEFCEDLPPGERVLGESRTEDSPLFGGFASRSFTRCRRRSISRSCPCSSALSCCTLSSVAASASAMQSGDAAPSGTTPLAPLEGLSSGCLATASAEDEPRRRLSTSSRKRSFSSASSTTCLSRGELGSESPASAARHVAPSGTKELAPESEEVVLGRRRGSPPLRPSS